VRNNFFLYIYNKLYFSHSADQESGEEDSDEDDGEEKEDSALPAKQQKLDPKAQNYGKKLKNGLENGYAKKQNPQERLVKQERSRSFKEVSWCRSQARQENPSLLRRPSQVKQQGLRHHLAA
jgi:hypothetical protein